MRGIRLYVGGTPANVRGERVDQSGYRCFTAAHSPVKMGSIEVDANEVFALMDSGAFTDPPSKRLSPDAALDRQIAWERRFSEMVGQSWQAEMFASYDLLIDEKWIDGKRIKRRWSVKEGDSAVEVTVAAASYLSSRRRDLRPRGLLLACQGVDAWQYEECVDEVLKFATPDDAIGFGGWCILGRFTSWLPTFWETCWRTFPKIERAGLRHVHIFGVMYERALAPALAMADEFGLWLSVDSSKPAIDCTWANPKKAGVRAPGVNNNVEWWRDRLRGLRDSPHYHLPRRLFARPVEWEQSRLLEAA